MPDYIEIRNGEASFAYNADNGDPWHTLGQGVRGAGTKEQMLELAHANFEVMYAPVHIETPDGLVLSDTHKATVRNTVELGEEGVTTTTDVFGIVGVDYAVDQNTDTTEWALALVGASEDDAVIDTMGVLRDGKEFFVGIDLGTLVLDPDGIGDVVKRYLVARNAHDGTLSLSGYPTNTRVVCWNTATMSYNEASRAKQVYRVRHTKNKDLYKAEAVKALALEKKLSELFAEQAMQMIGVDGGHDLLDRVIKDIWPVPEPGDTPTKQTNWDNRRTSIHALFEAPTNAGGFGESGWTVYNTITEYLDHKRPRSTVESRARAAINLDGEVAKAKDKAAQLVLAA